MPVPLNAGKIEKQKQIFAKSECEICVDVLRSLECRRHKHNETRRSVKRNKREASSGALRCTKRLRKFGEVLDAKKLQKLIIIVYRFLLALSGFHGMAVYPCINKIKDNSYENHLKPPTLAGKFQSLTEHLALSGKARQ